MKEDVLRSTRTANVVDEYKLHETLGRSAAFQVRRATRRASGEQCAIKLLHLKDALVTPRGDPAIELLSEIEILKALQGTPGVVSLLDHLRQIEPPIMAAVFELLMGGDLFDRIETHGPCTEPEAAQIAQQVGGALAHMHSLKIVHRDIKPDNLAFASRDGAIEVKLIDFGFAVVCPQAKLRGLSGTMDYAAPELVSWYAESQEVGAQSPLGVGAVEGTPYDEVSPSSSSSYTPPVHPSRSWVPRLRAADAGPLPGVPRALREEVAAVLPGQDLGELLVVPTTQASDLDLVRTGEAVDREKDALLERFFAWARAVADHLAAAGHWCDYIDPCSGLPMVDRSGHRSVYDEVSALAALRQYRTSNAGCCKIVLHPRWGSSVYPATLFTAAPPEALAAAVAAAEAALAAA